MNFFMVFAISSCSYSFSFSRSLSLTQSLSSRLCTVLYSMCLVLSALGCKMWVSILPRVCFACHRFLLYLMLAFCGRYCWINQYWWKNFRLFFYAHSVSVSIALSLFLSPSHSFSLYHSFSSSSAHKRWMEKRTHRTNERTNKQMVTFKTTNYFCTQAKWRRKLWMAWSKIQV